MVICNGQKDGVCSAVRGYIKFLLTITTGILKLNNNTLLTPLLFKFSSLRLCLINGDRRKFQFPACPSSFIDRSKALRHGSDPSDSGTSTKLLQLAFNRFKKGNDVTDILRVRRGKPGTWKFSQINLYISHILCLLHQLKITLCL